MKMDYKPKTDIEKSLYDILALIVKEKFGADYVDDIELEHPADESHGDFSTNIAMKLAGKLGKNPRKIAEVIIADWKSRFFGEPEIAGPGFINFKIYKSVLADELYKIFGSEKFFGRSVFGQGQHILLEHTSANPNKAMHIGHVRNNVLGNALINILEAVGYKVTADYIVNDRGTSISKIMWGYLNFAKKDNSLIFKNWGEVKPSVVETSFEQLLEEWAANPQKWLSPEDNSELKPDELMEKAYVLGSNAAKEIPWVEKQVSEILVSWEKEEEKNRKLWKQIREWVFTGQKETMKRLGSRTDHYWFESEFYKGGKEIVEKGLEKGVFRRDGDAVVTNFEKHGLPDTIVIKSDGTALYITQDLKLTELKTQKFPSVKYIWVVGAEQSLTLKQAFLADYLLGIVDDLNKLYHFAYGLFVAKDGGKIGSRKGNVISADNLIDMAVEKASEVVQEKNRDYSEEEIEDIAEKVGLGALKYFILKANAMTTLKFDVDEAMSFEGDTAPYLLYTYARAKSILRDGNPGWEEILKRVQNDSLFLKDSEMTVLRTLYRFPEIVVNAADGYAPNYVADYIFDLAQKYNAFYRECPVLSAEEDVKNSRLLLTASTAQVIKNGLNLLGIETLERM